MQTEIDNNILQMIDEEAHRRYPSEKLGTKGMIDATRRRYFVEEAIYMHTHNQQQK